MTSSYVNDICKDRVFKSSHIARSDGLGFKHIFLGNTIQLTMKRLCVSFVLSVFPFAILVAVCFVRGFGGNSKSMLLPPPCPNTEPTVVFQAHVYRTSIVHNFITKPKAK